MHLKTGGGIHLLQAGGADETYPNDAKSLTVTNKFTFNVLSLFTTLVTARPSPLVVILLS